MSDFFHIKSIAQCNEFFGIGKPIHPLITIIHKWPEYHGDIRNVKFSSDLYLLSMKGKMKDVSIPYGRSSYDFEEGALVFLAPNQVLSFPSPIEESDDSGWTILFHPDLIRRYPLGKGIKEYSFFNYEINESLHLSEKEKLFLIELVEKIEVELNQTTDKHSQDLIVQNLETILKYSNRYYDRQFYSRSNLNKDLVTKFEDYLKEYFASEELVKHGIPSVKKCGEGLNISGSYLSDLLRIETGRSAKDHIHGFIIEEAKTALLNSKKPISQIAYDLGFEYSQHFSKLFKAKTGMNPTEYRSLN